MNLVRSYITPIWLNPTGSILIGLALRIVWAILVPVIPISDGNAYDVFAQNLADGHGYGWDENSPTAYWPPGTSFVYSLIYQVFGHTYLPIVILNLFLFIVIAWTSIYLAEKWFNRQVALITGFLLAIWPVLIQFTTILASELLFTALVLSALSVWFTRDIPITWRVVCTGFLSAAASYVRPTAILIPILLLIFQFSVRQERLRSTFAVGAILALMLVVLAPWSYRNTQLFGQFVTISTNSGANLWMGNNPESSGEYMPLPSEVKGMNEADRDSYLKSVAIDHIKQNPILFARRCLIRLVHTHSRESIGVVWNEKGLKSRYGELILLPLKLINQLYWMTILGIAIGGILLLIKSYGWISTMTSPPILLWGYYAVIHAIVVAQDRYHLPSNPFIAMLAGVAVVFWFNELNLLAMRDKA